MKSPFTRRNRRRPHGITGKIRELRHDLAWWIAKEIQPALDRHLMAVGGVLTFLVCGICLAVFLATVQSLAVSGGEKKNQTAPDPGARAAAPSPLIITDTDRPALAGK